MRRALDPLMATAVFAVALCSLALASPFVGASLMNNYRAQTLLANLRGQDLPGAQIVAERVQVANWWSSNMCILFAGVVLATDADEETVLAHYLDLDVVKIGDRFIQHRLHGDWTTPCTPGSGEEGPSCSVTSFPPGFWQLLDRVPDAQKDYYLVWDAADRLPGLDLRCN